MKKFEFGSGYTIFVNDDNTIKVGCQTFTKKHVLMAISTFKKAEANLKYLSKDVLNADPETFMKKGSTTNINTRKFISGRYVTGKIEGDSVKGILVFVKSNDSFYFCQNKKDGAAAPFRHGYKCSWIFQQNEDGSFNANVSDLKFPKAPETIKPIEIGYKIKLGDFEASITSKYLYVDGDCYTKAQILKICNYFLKNQK